MRAARDLTRFPFGRPQYIAAHDYLLQNKERIIPVQPAAANTISSTMVRRLLAQKKSIKYLVPDAVRDYIKRHKLAEQPAWQEE